MAHAESVKKYSVGDSPEIALWGDSDLPEIFKWSASSAKVANLEFLTVFQCYFKSCLHAGYGSSQRL